MSEMADQWRADRLVKQGRSQQRRDAAAEQYAFARQIAERNGYRLRRHTETHYSLEWPSGARINIYPGNKRIVRDRNRPKPPYLKLPDEWRLFDVVAAAVNYIAHEPPNGDPS